MTNDINNSLSHIASVLTDIREEMWRAGKSTSFTVREDYDVKAHASVHDILHALNEIKQHVRSMDKHGDYTGKDPHEVVGEIYDFICDQCSGLDEDLL